MIFVTVQTRVSRWDCSFMMKFLLLARDALICLLAEDAAEENSGIVLVREESVG